MGGPILDEVLERIALHARIVLCGSISSYHLEEKPPGPRNDYNLTKRRGRMEGFTVLDYFPRIAKASSALLELVSQGQIAWKVDMQQGFENAPRTLLRLYSGANFGKQLLEI